MFITYFNNIQLIFLVSGGLCFSLSLFYHLRENERLSFSLIILSALLIYIFAALLDPFLNIWDERFHALVAKNLMNHPLKPTLYDDPVVLMEYDRWDRFHIWLHKQPLFLWQIALSYKIFGVSEFSTRIPSAILGVVMVGVGYRTGKLMINTRVGFITATFILSSYYFIELIAGRKTLEHNDVSFIVYTSLSIWALLEYYYSKKRVWIFVIGLFSGFAILCKWLPGLLVYLGWIILYFQSYKWKIFRYKDIMISFAITVIIALPWQLIILILYPSEALSAYEFSSAHFYKPIEGHSGTFWYYFEIFNLIYGKLAAFLIIPSLMILYGSTREKKIYVSLLGMIIFVYLFYSIAETKMPSYTLLISLPIAIAFASLTDYLLRKLKDLNLPKLAIQGITFLVILTIAAINIDIDYLQEQHTLWKIENKHSRMMMHNKKVFNDLNLPPNTVIFNIRGAHYVEAMFYTGLPSYKIVPSYEQYLDLKDKGKLIAIFKSLEGDIPPYLESDSTVIVLNEKLQGYN